MKLKVDPGYCMSVARTPRSDVVCRKPRTVSEPEHRKLGKQEGLVFRGGTRTSDFYKGFAIGCLTKFLSLMFNMGFGRGIGQL